MTQTAVTVTPQASHGRGPGRPRSDEAERAIIEAALDLIAEHGVSGVSIEQIAARAGVAKTTVYRRWPDKQSLALDAIEHLKGPAPTAPGGSVRDDLLYLMKVARDNSRTGRAGKILPRLFAEVRENPHMVDACRHRIITPRRQAVIDVLSRGVDEGLIRADTQLDLVVDMLMSPILTAPVNRASRHTDAELCTIVDILLRGIAAGTSGDATAGPVADTTLAPA